jgi:hypothetical protein
VEQEQCVVLYGLRLSLIKYSRKTKKHSKTMEGKEGAKQDSTSTCTSTSGRGDNNNRSIDGYPLLSSIVA